MNIQLFSGSGDPQKPQNAFHEDTYYQILYVEPDNSEIDAHNIKTSILAKKRGATPESSTPESTETSTLRTSSPSRDSSEEHPEKFNYFNLDRETIDNLKDYPRYGGDWRLSSYLPSPGVIFSDGFINSCIKVKEDDQIDDITKLSDYKTQLGNYYTTIRFLLHSRKISQLVAKTWWAYLRAKEISIGEPQETLWEKFCTGKWQEIYDAEHHNVLDGLIAREIFLYGGADSPDNICDEDVYSSLTPEPGRQRFLILPTSKAWQGISLSLLLAGQAYYQVTENDVDKYHQIHPSILSTGEITMQYTLEVDWSRFQADIKEIIISNEKPWVAYHVLMPYPPIPNDADPDNLKKWADAKEEPEQEDHFPFYKKDKDGNYLVDVGCFRPPYPYIPLSST
ncbi:MAG: hypothetical protein F6J86_01400 [Symploca sp. SIO1B1]|nr:hypothetical protein [Symploca sp. SIO1C2]NER92517.1 hypothetical protein [Symploca sp. SIO1B1]